MKLNRHVEIERRENGDYLISWTESFSANPIAIRASALPDDAHSGEVLYRGNHGAIRVDSLRAPRRHYFHLEPEGTTGVTMGERALIADAGYNLRDLGGYLTGDGRQVRWGRLYRSGRLPLSEPGEREFLAHLDIRKNCDFRVNRDFVEDANNLHADTERHNFAVDAGGFSNFFEELTEDQLNEAFMIECMRDVNRQLARDYQPEFRNMFRELLALEEGAFLFNCTAGKDRTGFAAALILSALGVPRETILEDYLLSGRYFKPPKGRKPPTGKYSPEVLKIFASDAVRPLAEVRREYLQAAFDTMDELSGSTEQFLQDACGIGGEERALLRERFTVDGPDWFRGWR